MGRSYHPDGTLSRISPMLYSSDTIPQEAYISRTRLYLILSSGLETVRDLEVCRSNMYPDRDSLELPWTKTPVDSTIYSPGTGGLMQ